MKKTFFPLLFAILAAAASVYPAWKVATRDTDTEIYWPGTLRGVLEIRSVADTSNALVVGYNYYLLERYAKERNQKIDIILAERNLSYIDSLKTGAVDIVVFPYGTDFDTDRLVESTPIDSSIVWLMHDDRHSIMRDVNSWIDEWHNSGDYHEIRDSYLKRFNIFRSGARRQISPYDPIIRAYADSAGCDWRLVAAIIYKESRFHIEAQSRRGARGLMQMMPHTADRFGAGDPLDPETNIRAGVELLGSLIERYSHVGATQAEVIRFALAAYNAGVGRIDDCISYARLRNVDTGFWDNIVEIIPEMSADDIMETGVVKVGPFKGVETIEYVDKVALIYDRIKAIYRE